MPDLRIAEYWSERYKKAHGIAYPTRERKEWVNLQRAAKRYGDKRIRWCIYKFHLDPRFKDDKWVAEQQAFSLFSFLSRLQVLLTLYEERRHLSEKEEVAEIADQIDQVEGLAQQMTMFSGGENEGGAQGLRGGARSVPDHRDLATSSKYL